MAKKYIGAITAAETISDTLGVPLSDLVDIFAGIPAADVAEVVRCKDCKHYTGKDCLTRGMVFPKPDDWCNMGERKEGKP